MESVRQFYASRRLLLTGGTGFLGKALLETLVRETEPETINLLIRSRGSKSGRDRFEREILSSSAFEPLKNRMGEDKLRSLLESRIQVLEGDVTRDRFGLDPDTYERLLDDLDLIIHTAGLTDFDAPLDRSLSINVEGTRRLARATRESSAFFVHVSTCYVNHYGGPVLERPLPASPASEGPVARYDIREELTRLDELLETTETEEERIQLGMREARRRNHHDTYTYTKALAEQVLNQELDPDRRLIVRPSIIESALNNPSPGWIEAFKMCDPIFLAMGKGQLPEFPGNPEAPLDIVPVDVVVNALLCGAAYRARSPEPELFHVATSGENPMTTQECADYASEHFSRFPLKGNEPGDESQTKLVPPGEFFRSLKRYKQTPLSILRYMLLPGARVPGLSNVYEQVAYGAKKLDELEYYGGIYSPYTNTHTKYLTYHLRELWSALEDGDRERFPFRIHSIDWSKYIQETHIPGCKRYLMPFRSETNVEPEPVSLPTTDGEFNQRGDGKPSDIDEGPYLRYLTPTPSHSTHSNGKLNVWEQRSWSERLIYQIGNSAWTGLGRLFASVDLEGREHLPERGPFIVAANHSSHSDTPFLLSAMGTRRARYAHPVAAVDYWFEQPALLRALFENTLNMVPVHRTSSRLKKALDVPLALLRQGEALIIYPEGTRGTSKEMRSFKVGLGLLALGAGVPVIPTAIDGTYDILPKNRVVPRPGTVRIRFGEQLRPEPYLNRINITSVKDEVRRVTEDAEEAVRTMRDSLRKEGARPART